MKKRLALLVCVASTLGATQSASAQGRGDWQIGGGLGVLTSLPRGTAFNLSFLSGVKVSDNVRVAPRLNLGFSDDLTVIGLLVDGHYIFDIKNANPRVRAIEPFVGGGGGLTMGFANGPGNVSDFAPTLEVSGGMDYRIKPRLTLGTAMHFTIPIDFFDDNFVFQWNLFTVRYDL